ncbi:MAG: non-hydrolyzing UDP-N-acetylglucosamine 2-epimerase [Candidatus Binataceae bacterium]
MKFYSIVGTRPNFVKEFLINRECRRRGIEEVFVHTGQHYDYEMSQVFFEDFDLPKPTHFLNIENTGNLQFTADVMVRLGELLRENRPDFVLSYGDVNSTLSAAVAASKLALPFAHVEGGIRSCDRYNPEEINRRVSDVLADVIYCCTQHDVNTLHKEGYEPRRVVLSGDLMNDALQYILSAHDIRPARGDYMLLTLHRQENVLSSSRLEAIVEGLIRAHQRIIFPVHPRTRKQLESFGLMRRLSQSMVEVIKPVGYVDFIKLAAGAAKILTDSGGVRREAYLLYKPCIVLIELSWFPDISKAGWKVLTGPDPERIASLINSFEPRTEHPNIFGDGHAYLKIIDDLESRYGN